LFLRTKHEIQEALTLVSNERKWHLNCMDLLKRLGKFYHVLFLKFYPNIKLKNACIVS